MVGCMTCVRSMVPLSLLFLQDSHEWNSGAREVIQTVAAIKLGHLVSQRFLPGLLEPSEMML